MRTWERIGYTVEEIEFDHDLHEFNVVQSGEVIATITPADLENMDVIIETLDAGDDVNGWEDGNGNVVCLNV